MTAQQLDPTTAHRQAHRNWQSNQPALSRRQPALASALAQLPTDVEWLLGRDGALTARDLAGWLSGSSLPRRTAEKLLEKLALRAPVVCFLAPTHAAQIRVTLERLKPGQALIAIVPDLADLRLILACEEFAPELHAGRLWFAAGDQWEAELERLLQNHDGLPLPQQFVRTALVEAHVIDDLIARAQSLFARQSQRRADWINARFTQSTPPVKTSRFGIWAPAAFRLWAEQGTILQSIARQEGWDVVDTDDPCQASTVALARLATTCDALLISNASRADLPVSLPPETKVITWLTRPVIPNCNAEMTNDRLLLADPAWRAQALSAGWRAEQITLATWPTWQPRSSGAGLAIIADTLPLVMPEFVLSSLNVLWESIAREIAAEPFAVETDTQSYLTRWQHGVGIADQAIDRATFIDRLIRPAYAQSLARSLLAAGVSVHLYGRGWGEIEEFAAHSSGEIRTRQDLERAVETCAALVHVWPHAHKHPMEAMGRPILRRGTQGARRWLQEARRLARGETRPPAPGDEISAPLIRNLP